MGIVYRNSGDIFKCDYCYEQINPKAIVCPHCSTKEPLALYLEKCRRNDKIRSEKAEKLAKEIADKYGITVKEVYKRHHQYQYQKARKKLQAKLDSIKKTSKKDMTLEEARIIVACILIICVLLYIIH